MKNTLRLGSRGTHDYVTSDKQLKHTRPLEPTPPFRPPLANTYRIFAPPIGKEDGATTDDAHIRVSKTGEPWLLPHTAAGLRTPARGVCEVAGLAGAHTEGAPVAAKAKVVAPMVRMQRVSSGATWRGSRGDTAQPQATEQALQPPAQHGVRT